VQPTIALVNEQAFSAGLVHHYLEAGYRALVMEWDNPAAQHPEWPAHWRYLPQRVRGTAGETIPVIWNHSIAFQKFQRYAHGEMALDDYVQYVGNHWAGESRALPLYGNDVEVFDFRPGRFHTEAALDEPIEWHRIRSLVERLESDDRFRWVAPSSVLELLEAPGGGNRLELGTCAHPIPVKKQRKYNLSRWAITGRDDLWLNTFCHRVERALAGDTGAAGREALWRRLCRLWASDYRTHIAPGRWQRALEEAAGLADALDVPLPQGDTVIGTGGGEPDTRFHIGHDDGRHRLRVETGDMRLVLNTRRGLAVDSLAFRSQQFVPAVGTLDHGYFQSIELGADFYTGGVVIELPMEHRRITDLNAVQPALRAFPDGLAVECEIDTDKGPIRKRLWIPAHGESLGYRVEFPGWVRPKATVRVAHVTLLPEAFSGALGYRCCNGGTHPEAFVLDGPCRHGDPASTLVSASTGLGATEGWLQLGDGRRDLLLQWDPARSAAFPMLHHQQSSPGALTRVIFSLAELDETTHDGGRLLPFELRVSPGAVN